MIRASFLTAAVAVMITGAAGTTYGAPQAVPDGTVETPKVVGQPLRVPGEGPAKESDCADKVDNDHDTVMDCGDADCFSAPNCQPGQGPENSDEACKDWVDNDGDGHIDCDDEDCEAPSLTVCLGSWQRAPAAGEAPASTGGTTLTTTGGGAATGGAPVNNFLPELTEGMSLEDLIGKAGDIDGERNDEVCSDGIDNDGDGRTDCADIGCQFDSSVTICQPSPDMRFSIVGSIAAGYGTTDTETAGTVATEAMPFTEFARLQLRALGPIPHIQDSFFLVSARAEKSFRVTFAMFQVPIKHSRHMLNINSGGGGLSQALFVSAAKQLLLEQPYYMYNTFDQGNGAAVELSGPILDNGKLLYRAFAAGGTGRWSGVIGGRYIDEEYDNYTWSTGGQLGINLLGYYSRFDTPFIYTPVPLTWGILAGAKFDQRNDEQYAAMNIQSTFRYRRFILMGESYTKKDLNFDFWGQAYNVTAGFLVWPKKVMIAADYGEYRVMNLDPAYVTGDSTDPDADGDEAVPGADLRRERSEMQWRVAAHYYFFRNIGMLSLLYTDRDRQKSLGSEDRIHSQEVRVEAQYRF